MSTLKSVVLTFGENYVWGGFAGEPSPRFSIDYDFDAKFPSTRIRLNELFQSIFVKHLQLKPKLCDVLVVEKFLVSSELRDHILSVLLRDCQVNSVSMQPDLLLGSLSSGASSGVVLNLGVQTCQVLCFVKGRPLIHTFKESTVGIAHAELEFNKSLNALLERNVGTKDSNELFRKVACGQIVSSSAPVEDIVIPPMQNVSGVSFSVPAQDRTSCLQCLVTGFAADGECIDENGGVAGILLKSLKACNNDVRHLAASNVIIIGSGADIPGLADDICRTATATCTAAYASESSSSCPLHSVVLSRLPEQRLRVLPAAFPRPLLAWVGGSLFASLKENKSAYVTLQDLVQRGKYSNFYTSESTVTVSEKDPFLLSAPDWQSLSASDWVFCRANTSAGIVKTM